MRFDIFTLFPHMFAGPFSESILKRATGSGLVSIRVHDVRAYTTDKHHVTDDYPYGGGGGMVMKPEPIFAAVEAVLGMRFACPSEGREGPLPPNPWPDGQDRLQSPIPIILLSPQGRLFTQEVARELVQHDHLALICGHYEGVDERVRQYLATDEISIGDYVLTGGELPAMVVVDAVTRLVPGVLGDPQATARDSFAEGLLEGPHYTRPAEFRGWRVPDVLLSGHHAEIARWRRQQALKRTWERRPDLLREAQLGPEDWDFLESLEQGSR